MLDLPAIVRATAGAILVEHGRTYATFTEAQFAEAAALIVGRCADVADSLYPGATSPYRAALTETSSGIRALVHGWEER